MFDEGRESSLLLFTLAKALEGEYIKRTQSVARPSGQTFFGFLQQNMACYPGLSVSVGKTQVVLGTAGRTAGILQVSTFQLQALHPIMGGKRKQNRITSRWECVYRLLVIFTLHRLHSWFLVLTQCGYMHLNNRLHSDF